MQSQGHYIILHLIIFLSLSDDQPPLPRRALARPSDRGVLNWLILSLYLQHFNWRHYRDHYKLYPRLTIQISRLIPRVPNLNPNPFHITIYILLNIFLPNRGAISLGMVGEYWSSFPWLLSEQNHARGRLHWLICDLSIFRNLVRADDPLLSQWTIKK